MTTHADPTPPVPVLAVHGNGGGAFRFRLVAPHVPAAIDWRPITLPGFSTSPPDPTLRTIADYAGHLGDRCDELAAETGHRPVVLGHGIGGSILLELLQHRPAAVAGVILHAPVGARLDRRLFPLAMRLPGARPTVQRMIAARPLRPLWRRSFFRDPVPPAYLAQFFEEYRACSVFADMFDLIVPGWFAGLHPVDVPAVVLWGGRDRVLSADQAGAFVPLLRTATVRIEPGWDHFPMIEQPADYAATVAELATGLVRPRPVVPRP